MRLKRKRLLRKPQEKALRAILPVTHPALLLSKRVGKTLVTIRYAKALGLKTCIIVCPITAVGVWEKELAAEGETYIRGYNLSSEKREKVLYELSLAETRVWLIINKEAILADCPVRIVRDKKRRGVPLIGQIAWDLFAIDETVFLANPQTQIYKPFMLGFRTVKHRMILSGNITPKTLLQVFGQFLFLRGEFMGFTDFYKWREEYFYQPLWDSYNWHPKKGSEQLIKDYVHKHACVITRRDADMEVNKKYEKVYVDMNSRQKKMYEEIEEDYAASLLNGSVAMTNLATTQHLWLRKLSGGFDPEDNLISKLKLEKLLELVKGRFSGEKVVVWCSFRNELYAIKEAIHNAGIGVAVVHGGISASERRFAIQTFNEWAATRIFLATGASAKFGIDVSVASKAIYYSNDFSPETRDQSEDRVVNVSSKVEPLIVDLVTRGSLDEIVLDVLKDRNVNSSMFHQSFVNEFWNRRLRK